MDTIKVVFGPTMFVVVIIFFAGLYRNALKKLWEIWSLWKDLLPRDKFDVRSLLQFLLYEVVLQKQIYLRDRYRWIRHILIYWSFAFLLLTDILLVTLSKIFPQKYFIVGQGRFILESIFDLTGLFLLAGTIVALIRAYQVRGTEKAIYNDTAAVIFLFCVVVTGYLVEALRLASSPYEPYMAYSFVGNLIAAGLRRLALPWESIRPYMWVLHAAISAAFILYIPFSRMIHICVVPLGRLMQSQRGLEEEKISGIVRGLIPDH